MERREDRNRRLGESFRQSRREMFVMLGVWLVLLAWSGTVCGLGARLVPEEPLVTMLGMPRWVFWGVALPWVVTCLFTFWFTMRFMKDTDLDPDLEVSEAESDQPSS